VPREHDFEIKVGSRRFRYTSGINALVLPQLIYIHIEAG